MTVLHQKQYSLRQTALVQTILTREEHWSCQGNSVFPRSPLYTHYHLIGPVSLSTSLSVSWVLSFPDPWGYGLSSFHWLAQMEEGWASEALLLPGSRMESWRAWCRASTWLVRDPLFLWIIDKSKGLFNLFILFTFVGVTTWSGLLNVLLKISVFWFVSWYDIFCETLKSLNINWINITIIIQYIFL